MSGEFRFHNSDECRAPNDTDARRFERATKALLDAVQKEEQAMSWSVGFEGNAEEVKGIFDKQRAQSASWGMIEAELKDIDATRDLVADFAQRCGRVVGTASGHWINAHQDAPQPPQLGQVQVCISLAKDQKVPTE